MPSATNPEQARRSKLETVFLSYHFKEDQELVLAIIKCVERQGLEVVTGGRLGGGEIPSVVKDRIRGADSLIALMTRRYKIGGSEIEFWDSHPWVRDELTYGYHLDKPAIPIVESGVEVAGAFSNYERITFDRDDWDSAIKALEQTLLLWTGRLGAKPIKVQMQPAERLRNLGLDDRQWCRYRWWLPPNLPENWVRTDSILREIGSLYFFARRPPDSSAMIEIEVLKDGECQWRSGWKTIEVSVELRRTDG